MAVVVDAAGVTVRRSDRALFEDLSVTVAAGDRVGVVGINGTGKSTLLRVLAGEQEPDSGVVRRGRGVRTAFLDQDPVLPDGSVAAAVGDGWEARAALSRLGVGMLADRPTDQLSGGQVKRVALACALAEPSELLILDEPTNHLDIVAVGWLTARLRSHPAGVVLVTHDRHLLDAVCTRVLELDRGRSYVHTGGYTSYLAAQIEREERSREAESVRRNLARRELAWLQRGAPARTRKPAARIANAKRVIGSRPLEAARGRDLELGFGTPRLGDQVIEAHDLSFRYGQAAVLDAVTLDLAPDDRLGVVGANGTGKSTLLDLLDGTREPAAGRVVRGPTAVIGHYRQEGPGLDPQARVREVVAGPSRAPGGPEDQALLERFWFGGALAFAPVSTLSGGERRRLQLLVVLAARPNVLLLDEPTNDLDIDTLRVLEEYLEGWPGALVTVSHDRAFLARTVERLVALAGDGSLRPVAGGLEAWLAEAEAAAGRAAASGTTAPAAVAATDVVARPKPVRRSGSGARLRTLERTMARLERERAGLEDRLGGAGGHADMARLGGELAAVVGQLQAAEEEWLLVAEEAETGR